jgi:choline dehydrogenase-like flavoprotein
MPRRKGITRRKFLIGMGAVGVALAGAGLYRHFNPARGGLVLPPLRLSELGDAAPYDVCIVGSGPAGAVLGLDLARAGFRTVILESGEAFGSMTPGLDELERYRSVGPIDYPARWTRVRALGGTSNVWTGRCSRLHPIDFERNAYTPADASWPISYADLRPYYTRADHTLRVRGGTLSKFHPPRDEPLPLPADMDISGLKKRLDGVGVVLDDSPSSTSAVGDGPIRAARDLLPLFTAQPTATLVSGRTATRLLHGPDGRVTAVEARSLDGDTRRVRARVFVVACGAVEAVRLLMLSRSDAFPEGIGNHSGHLGRHFMEHPNVRFKGRVEHTVNTLSPQYELGRCHQFYDAFKRQGLGSVLLVFSQSWVFRDDLKGWDLEAIGNKVANLFHRLVRAEMRIGATVEMAPAPDNRITLDPALTDHFGNPAAAVRLGFSERDTASLERARALIRKIYGDLGAEDVEEEEIGWSHHHLGGCRMGADPATSVVDPDLRVHGTANLYVAGSATFVTGGAAHPTPAITALAHRLGDHLAARLGPAVARRDRATAGAV